MLIVLPKGNVEGTTCKPYWCQYDRDSLKHWHWCSAQEKVAEGRCIWQDNLTGKRFTWQASLTAVSLVYHTVMKNVRRHVGLITYRLQWNWKLQYL